MNLVENWNYSDLLKNLYIYIFLQHILYAAGFSQANIEIQTFVPLLYVRETYKLFFFPITWIVNFELIKKNSQIPHYIDNNQNGINMVILCIFSSFLHNKLSIILGLIPTHIHNLLNTAYKGVKLFYFQTAIETNYLA